MLFARWLQKRPNHPFAMHTTTADQILPNDSPNTPQVSGRRVRMFTAAQIGVGGFLAIPAGFVMLAMNLSRAGKRGAAIATAVATPVVSYVLLLVGSALPEAAPRMLIPLLLGISLRKLAENQFHAEYEAAGDGKSVFEPFTHALLIVIAALLLVFAFACVAVSNGWVK